MSVIELLPCGLFCTVPVKTQTISTSERSVRGWPSESRQSV